MKKFWPSIPLARRLLGDSVTIQKDLSSTGIRNKGDFMAETQESERLKLPMRGVPQPGREDVLNLPHVHISSHPVMQHKMTALRDKRTSPPAFYRLVKEIGALLA